MKIIGMIPARGGSTRFNNKPLALICGKPMVYWVWKHSKEVECFDEVYVATDSEVIKDVAEGFGAKGYSCRTLAEFKAAFGEALKAKGPVWIECVIDREERVLPMIPAGKTVNDIIFN